MLSIEIEGHTICALGERAAWLVTGEEAKQLKIASSRIESLFNGGWWKEGCR